MVLQQSNHHAKATLFLALRPSTILPAASQGSVLVQAAGPSRSRKGFDAYSEDTAMKATYLTSTDIRSLLIIQCQYDQSRVHLKMLQGKMFHFGATLPGFTRKNRNHVYKN
jgi:hypothetical protein